MRKKIEKIVLIGAGNLATQLGLQLFKKGFCISQVYSRTEYPAKTLATKINAGYTVSLSEIDPEADLYICALKDDALPGIVDLLSHVKGIVVHTAGSVEMSIFEGKMLHYGVFYPLQTFSKNRNVDFTHIPVFIEANNPDTAQCLKEAAFCLSEKVYEANSAQRKMLHLSAVFACNFVNHLYTLSGEIAKEAGFDFKILLPLIDETAQKVHHLKPLEAQTGPAVRYDKTVMEKHLSLLSSRPEYQQIYRLLSDSIHKTI